jgi:hypothetical protein
MLVFAVISIADNAILEARVKDTYPFAHLKFASNVWFVADSGVTAQEVCQKIDVKSGGISGVMVTNVEKYFGFASNTLWDWIQVKLGEG